MSEYLRAAKNINTVAWCTNSIGAIAWSVCFFLLMRNPNKMKTQALQSVQMLTYHVSDIVLNQTATYYILFLLDEQPNWFNLKRASIINNTADFLVHSCFIVAHWQFAFDYFRLSYKTKLRNDNRPVETNKCLLHLFNYTVSATIILLAAIYTFKALIGLEQLSYLLFGILNSFLVLALLILSYGLWVLTKTAKLNNTQANAGMICIHIVAYVLCILAEYSFYIKVDSIKAYETSEVSVLTANLFSSLMLAWVVYKLS